LKLSAAEHLEQEPKRPRIAFVTMGVKLPGETMGYTRFASLAQIFCQHGYEVELITTSFQHWEKQQRSLSELDFSSLPYNVTLIAEPGYRRNIDPRRIASHRQAARNLGKYLAAQQPYQAIYAEVPPNNVAKAAGIYANAHDIPFIIDVNDLWPEAMKMVFDLPPLSTLAYWPMAADARTVYRLADGIVGTSEEYRARPYADGATATESLTVYVGNELAQFDGALVEGDTAGDLAGAQCAPLHDKLLGSLWVTYAGTLGESYDIANLINAFAELKACGMDNVELVLAGDGPKRAELEQQAAELGVNAQFLGFLEYADMARLLARSDVLVNSFAPKAPQSIVNKIADYLAAGKPVINTASSPEMRALLDDANAGLNVEPGDPKALADAIAALGGNDELRQQLGANGRQLAEQRFDRKTSYLAIVELIDRLL
jgi:glycosyltransferase involved in cell wall biosynthesis